MERLSGLDASFLYLETPTQHMHVSAAIVVDPAGMPGGYSYDRVKDMIEGRLHLAPPLRRRLATVPFKLNHPVWVEDPDFDLDQHVHRIGCPTPGGEREFAELVADISGRQLDRSRPLWELWVVEGLRDGLLGIVAKMHHSTIDGVSGANLMVHFLDLEPDPAPKPLPEEEWRPERPPGDLRLAAEGLVARATRPWQLAGTLVRTVQAAGAIVANRFRGDGTGMTTPLTAPRTSFNGAITSHRTIAFARIPLAEVKEVKNAHGLTVNDVVLGTCAGALRRYLERHDALPDKALSAVVPVSVRGDDEKLAGTNRVSALFTSLATDVDDPIERLRTIHEVSVAAKEEHNAIGADLLQKWGDLAAPNTFSMAARVFSAMKLAERFPVPYNLVISNVPGPPIPLYFAGAKLVEMYPLGPVMHGLGLNVTVLSYMDTLYWGLIAAKESIPDLWDLAAEIPVALAELRHPPVRATRRAARKRAPAAKRPATRSAKAAG